MERQPSCSQDFEEEVVILDDDDEEVEREGDTGVAKCGSVVPDVDGVGFGANVGASGQEVVDASPSQIPDFGDEINRNMWASTSGGVLPSPGINTSKSMQTCLYDASFVHS